ncbi:hypothetical protein EDD15DRAFT_1828480 [Pisolithus albus]|nr:hypothetical protein EDD15DRAFT_1828480 [Pisolithus albus]
MRPRAAYNVQKHSYVERNLLTIHANHLYCQVAMSGNMEFTYESKGRLVTQTLKGDRIDSHEGIGVWKIDHCAWKMFSKETEKEEKKCRKRVKEYLDADSSGLPMGEPRFEHGTIKEGKNEYPGMALIVNWFDGTNFHLTKDRHQSKPFKSALQKQNISHSKSSTDYMRIKAGCECAKTVGLQDCQGYVEAGGREPIVFIDIHTGTSTTAAEEMVEIINEWGE